MAARESGKATMKMPEQVEEQPEPLTQRKRPEKGRFQLQVDRQTKGSYPTAKAAEEAGMAIKKAYPVVQVSVYDSVEFSNTLVGQQ
jgi:hypothetical protein